MKYSVVKTTIEIISLEVEATSEKEAIELSENYADDWWKEEFCDTTRPQATLVEHNIFGAENVPAKQ